MMRGNTNLYRITEARSSVVERCFDVAEVSGSIPLAPTSIDTHDYFIEPKR